MRPAGRAKRSVLWLPTLSGTHQHGLEFREIRQVNDIVGVEIASIALGRQGLSIQPGEAALKRGEVRQVHVAIVVMVPVTHEQNDVHEDIPILV
jgi:hypothetical protein